MAAAELFNIYRFFSHIFQVYKNKVFVFFLSCNLPPTCQFIISKKIWGIPTTKHAPRCYSSDKCVPISPYHQLQRILCLVSCLQNLKPYLFSSRIPIPPFHCLLYISSIFNLVNGDLLFSHFNINTYVVFVIYFS